MVAQIDEQHAAMVADAMAPAGQANGLADMALAERAAGLGPVTMHGCLKQMSEGSESGTRGQPETRVGLPEQARRGNRMRELSVIASAAVAVGTLISERPPHRSVRAAFP